MLALGVLQSQAGGDISEESGQLRIAYVYIAKVPLALRYCARVNAGWAEALADFRGTELQCDGVELS